jgi:anti-sigma factor (TIGR02949 family)
MIQDNGLDCSEVVRALWEYLDGRASDGLVAGIDAHLSWCEGCRSHFAFEKRLVKTLAGLRREHSDPERLRAAVLEVLRAAGSSRA